MEVSPDGRFVGLATEDDALTLFDVSERTATRLGPGAAVTAVAFSADSSRIATGAEDGTVRVWDTATRQEVRSLIAHPESSPLEFEDELLERGVDLRTFVALGGSSIDQFSRGVSGLAFVADGERLISAEPPVARVWDLSSPGGVEPLDQFFLIDDNTRFGFGRTVPAIERLQRDPSSAAHLAIATRNTLLRLNWRTGELQQVSLPTDRTDTNTTSAGAWLGPEGTWVASLSDGRIRVLDGAGSPTATFQHRLGRPSDLAVDADGRRVAVAGAGGIAVFALDDATLLSHTLPRASFTTAVSASGDADHIAQGGFIERMELWRRIGDGAYRKVELPDSVAGQSGVLVALADGRSLLSGFEQSWPPTTWFDTESLVELGRIETLGLHVGTSQDGRYLASALSRLDAPFASTSIGVWDTRTSDLVAELEQPASSRGSFRSFAFDADGSLLIATTQDGSYAAWSLVSDDRVEIPVDLGPVVVAGFSPDGRRLATVDPSGAITIRDATTFAAERVLLGANPPNDVGGTISWSPDGSVLLSQFDIQPRLWDVETGRQLGDPFPNDPEVTYGTTWGTSLVTAVDDRVHVWNLDLSAWPEIACQAAGRNMTDNEWEQFGPRGEPYRVTCPQYPAGGE